MIDYVYNTVVVEDVDRWRSNIADRGMSAEEIVMRLNLSVSTTFYRVLYHLCSIIIITILNQSIIVVRENRNKRKRKIKTTNAKDTLRPHAP